MSARNWSRNFKQIKHSTHVQGSVRGTFNAQAKLPTSDFQSHRFICLGFCKGTNGAPCCNFWREKNYCRFFGYNNVLGMRMVSCGGYNKPAPTDEVLDKGLNIIEVLPAKPTKPKPLPDSKNRIVVTAFPPEQPKVSKVVELPTKIAQPVVEPLVRVVKETQPYEFTLFPKFRNQAPQQEQAVIEQVSVSSASMPTLSAIPAISEVPKPAVVIDDWWQSLNQALQAVPKAHQSD